MTLPLITIHPTSPTEIFLVLHEHASRPEGKEWEYMTGQLRQKLDANAYGLILTAEGQRRAVEIGTALRGVKISAMITKKFSVTERTAELILSQQENPESIPVVTDPRVRESDLSYLTLERFKQLGEEEHQGNPNATIEDWIQNCKEDFQRIVGEHISLWNEYITVYTGGCIVFVLHVEGLLLLICLLLGLDVKEIVRLHIPRGCPFHIRLSPERKPIISIHDEVFWSTKPSTPFAQYR